MTRLSVIVPVYNVEEYLDECLRSLEAQTFRDFEAICVNDGSTDSSREILSAWEAQASWVKVVDKENGGLSSARNAGIHAASGNYICFLDSDDRLMPNACEAIVEAFEACDAEVLVYGGYALPRSATSSWLEETLSPQEASYDGVCEELLFRRDTRPFAWRTAVSRAFILRENVLFDEGITYGEDQVFQFAAYARSRKTVIIGERLYEYRVTRSGSLMSDVRKDERKMLLEHVNILRIVLDDYASLGILGDYARSLLSWSTTFIATDALMLPDASCSEVLRALGKVVASYWDKETVAQLGLDRSEEKVLEAALAGEELSGIGRMRLAVPLNLHHYGRLSTLRMVLGLNRGLT